MIRGIIFDMDGVIIDSNHVHYSNWNGVFEKHFNVTIPKKEFAQHLGESSGHFCQHFHDAYNINMSIDELWNMTRKGYEAVREKINLKPGVADALRRLSPRYKIALATGADEAHARHILDRFGIKEHFSFVIAGDMVKRAKPDPDIFLRAAEGIGLSPSDCVVIEDAEMGLQAAKAAGMKCIMIEDDLTKYQDHSAADRKIFSFSELTEKLISSL